MPRGACSQLPPPPSCTDNTHRQRSRVHNKFRRCSIQPVTHGPAPRPETLSVSVPSGSAVTPFSRSCLLSAKLSSDCCVRTVLGARPLVHQKEARRLFREGVPCDGAGEACVSTRRATSRKVEDVKMSSPLTDRRRVEASVYVLRSILSMQRQSTPGGTKKPTIANPHGCAFSSYSQGFVEEIFVELFHAGLFHLSLSAGSVRAPFPLLVPPLEILACVRFVCIRRWKC